MIEWKRSRVAALMLVAAAAWFSSSFAHADNLPTGGGCYVTGDILGYAEFLECTYTAQSDTQTVYVGTPNYWRIYVWRDIWHEHETCFDPQIGFYDCAKFVSEQILLADGYGPLLKGDGQPRDSAIIQVHPNAGETVHIEMKGDCAPDLGTTCGKLGVVGAYE